MVIRYIAAACIVIAAGIYAGDLRAGRSFAQPAPALERLPVAFDGWHARDTAPSAGILAALAADATLHRCYRRGDGTEVCLFIAYFAQQQVNSQIHSPRHCLPGGGWSVSRLQPVTLPGDQYPQATTRMRIVRQGTAQDVYYWFATQTGTVTDEYALKWQLVKAALARRPTNAAFVRFSAAASDSVALREVFTEVHPELAAILAEVGLR